MVHSAGTSPPLDLRFEYGRDWILETFEESDEVWKQVTGDAGNRRYFRGKVDGKTMILMDSEHEHQGAFVDICNRLRKAGLHAPEIIQFDLDRGYLLLEDLGEELYRDLLSEDNVEQLLGEALDALAVMRGVDTAGLPRYGPETLRDELFLFPDLYLLRHKSCRMLGRRRDDWQELCNELVAAASAQPEVFVHRDIHSCNLLRTESNSPGIIDFQDAVAGPLTYDFVSLIWDRYIHWPRPRIEQWMEQYRLRVAPATDADTWRYWCDMTGLQRNLRIVGRFAELKYWEDKDGYIELIPMFYRHVLDVLALYPQFESIAQWLGSDACAP
jgi:aminoglycoside/choline kinase family phosphotransferase